MTLPRNRPVLVTGASGYVGSRLVPRLLSLGYRVRAGSRDPDSLRVRPWSDDPAVERVRVDVLEPGSVRDACAGCSAAFYLVHSMVPGQHDFAAADREGAQTMARAAEEAGLRRIVYLGGLGDPGADVSLHLRSREEVGAILSAGRVPVTILRAAMILGAGSGSFEILRYLVERLPVMVTPRWVRTESQPIAIRNVLDYLAGCLDVPKTAGGTFDIGGPEIATYRALMDLYAEEAGLRRRWILPVPVLTPRLSSYWIDLVTPAPAALARPLALGLGNRLVCREERIRALIPVPLVSCREAVRAAVAGSLGLPRGDADGATSPEPESGILPGDPEWMGGTVFRVRYRVAVGATPEEAWRPLARIGGTAGWYFADWLWSLRGGLDRLTGGRGMRRGRPREEGLFPGDLVDCWRVEAADPGRRLLLSAEMRLPGGATLEYRLRKRPEGGTGIEQLSTFVPRGLAGILYWGATGPFHRFLFPGLLREIARRSGGRILSGPERLAPDPFEPAERGRSEVA